jgi:putative transcriptional regulator
MGSGALEPGTLLVAAPSEDADPVFGRTVVLIVDREPNGIITGLAINRPLSQRVADTAALALVFVPDPSAIVFWGGPMGDDPAILAQLGDTRGLEWFHLGKLERRPFPLPDVGLIALGEHPEPFESRIRRARLYLGLCVWEAGQLESEVEQGVWHLANARADDLFRADPANLWSDLLAGRS